MPEIDGSPVITPFEKTPNLDYFELSEKLMETQDFVTSFNSFNNVPDIERFLNNYSPDQLVQLLRQSVYFASSIDELPRPSNLCFIASRFLSDKEFSPPIQGNISYKPWQQYMLFKEEIGAKLEELSKDFPDKILQNNYENSLIEEKAYLLDRLQPGQFFGHGGYLVDFDSVIENGLMSNQTIRTECPQNYKGDHYRFMESNETRRDGLLLSFFSTQRLEEETMPTHWGWCCPGTFYEEKRKETDIAYYFPAESLVDHSKYIHTIGYNADAEYAISNNPLAIEDQTAIPADTEDHCSLPLSEAYLVIKSNDEPAIRLKLHNHGYTEEWIQKHIYILDEMKQTFKIRNPYIDAFFAQRQEIMSWLRGNVTVDKSKVTKLAKIKDQIRNSMTGRVWKASMESKLT